MPKSIVVCCDGTWNKLRNKDVTNVVKLCNAFDDTDVDGNVLQAQYFDGVGTKFGEKLIGGIFGYGLSRKVREAYEYIATNYEPGDKVYLFGFSRGAYTARSTAGMIRNVGILRPDEVERRIDEAFAIYRDRDDARKRPGGTIADGFRAKYSHPHDPDRPEVQFIGVWDTVGAEGIPLDGLHVLHMLNHRWRFHDTKLSGRVPHAYQALAVDEFRASFKPTIWELDPADAAKHSVEQAWFTGSHSDVGGGYAESGLSDLALQWMADRAEDGGLRFKESAVFGKDPMIHVIDGPVIPVRPDPALKIHESRRFIFRIVPRAVRQIGVRETDQESASWAARDRIDLPRIGYVPANLLAFVKQWPDRVSKLRQRV